MQEASRTPNSVRSKMTRAALVQAGRALFVEHGFAGTGTPLIVARAGVTRGALYHHFADKQALFAAVVEQEWQAVAEAVEAVETVPSPQASPIDVLVEGGQTYLDAMAVPGRVRLLLIETPSVLDRAQVEALDARHGGRTLREGLQAAMAAGAIAPLPLTPLVQILGAAYDRAALAMADGVDRKDCLKVIESLVRGLAPSR